MWCRCYPETVSWRNLSSHACGICHWLLSTVENLARNCGSCLALSSFMWLVLSKRCSTLHLTSLAAACKRAVCCIVRRKTFQRVDVGQSSEKGPPFTGRVTKAFELLTVQRWGGVSGKSSHSHLCCHFAFPIQCRSPDLYLLLPMLLCMRDLGECMWDPSFKFCGKHRPVTLVLQDPFYSTFKFPDIKLCFSSKACIWDVIESHMYCRGLIIAVLNISVAYHQKFLLLY